jgi:hypothetical protein
MRFFALTARTTSQIVNAIGIPKINKMTSVIFFCLNSPLREHSSIGDQLATLLASAKT